MRLQRIATSLVLALSAVLLACSSGGAEQAAPAAPTTVGAAATTAATPAPTPGPSADATPPSGLALPFDLADIEGSFSPFGVYRSTMDLPEFGHSGIDVPLLLGAPIYAVADGIVIAVAPAGGSQPGSNVTLLIQPSQRDGDGWVFLYEHIDLVDGLVVGSSVLRGEQIAVNPIETYTGNNHLELSFVSSGLISFPPHICWADRLDQPSREALTARFDEVHLEAMEQLRIAKEEANSSAELLDADSLPKDPRLCYELGTVIPAGS